MKSISTIQICCVNNIKMCYRGLQDPQIISMNSSSYGLNMSSSLRRDSYSTAVAKNVIVLSLGLTINYINGTLIHTLRKHQVRMLYHCYNNYKKLSILVSMSIIITVIILRRTPQTLELRFMCAQLRTGTLTLMIEGGRDKGFGKTAFLCFRLE